MDERTTRVVIGSALLGVGVFLSVSFYNALELLLYAAAGLMGLAGLIALPYLVLKRKPVADVGIAAGVGVGGIALAVHDLVPGGFLLHVLAALAAFAGGGTVLYRALLGRPGRRGSG